MRAPACFSDSRRSDSRVLVIVRSSMISPLASIAQIACFLSPMSIPMVTPSGFGSAFGFRAGLAVFLDVVLVFIGRVYHGARGA